MTIEKGKDWAQPYPGGGRVISVANDAELAGAAASLVDDDTEAVYLTVSGGDVARSLGFGVRGHDAPTTDGDDRAWPLVYPMDLGRLEAGPDVGTVAYRLPFVSHVLGHRRPGFPWVWPELVAVNAPLVGGLRLGPRAHLNDGLIDVTVGRLPWRQATEAHRRAKNGAHLPHPALRHERRSTYEYESQSLRLTVDGEPGPTVSWLRISIVPDAFQLVMPAPDVSSRP